MNTAWVVVRHSKFAGIEIDGVYSTKERALAACGPDSLAVPLDVDRDYTDETEFLVATPRRPEGYMNTGRVPSA